MLKIRLKKIDQIHGHNSMLRALSAIYKLNGGLDTVSLAQVLREHEGQRIGSKHDPRTLVCLNNLLPLCGEEGKKICQLVADGLNESHIKPTSKWEIILPEQVPARLTRAKELALEGRWENSKIEFLEKAAAWLRANNFRGID
jgi:hypothetical protein